MRIDGDGAKGGNVAGMKAHKYLHLLSLCYHSSSRAKRIQYQERLDSSINTQSINSTMTE